MSLATDRLSEAGVGIVQEKVNLELRCIFRSLTILDYGIDGHIEVCYDEADKPSGQLVGVQVKTGKSYLEESDEHSYIFRPSSTHVTYWLKYSLPVIVVLVDADSRVCFWEVAEARKIESTGKGFKMKIPKSQVLSADARESLLELIEDPAFNMRFANLCYFRTLIKKVATETDLVVLEAEEWINKSSGQGSMRVKAVAEGKDGVEERVEEEWDWPFVMFPGTPYEDLFANLFPWAELSVDLEFYEPYDEEEWDESCGIWDSEVSEYVMHTERFSDWRSTRPAIRPFEIASGEVACYRLELKLNSLGVGFLAVDQYLESGRGPNFSTSRSRNLGLKGLAKRFSQEAPGDPVDKAANIEDPVPLGGDHDDFPF